MGEGRSFFDDLPTMDIKKATRLIVYGILLAIIFGAIAIISINLDSNATSLYNLMEIERANSINEGLISYDEYVRQGVENLQLQRWLQTQDIWFITIARVGGYIAVFLVAIGFLSLGLNDRIEEKARRMYLIIGGIVTFLLVMSVLGMTLSAEIT